MEQAGSGMTNGKNPALKPGGIFPCQAFCRSIHAITGFRPLRDGRMARVDWGTAISAGITALVGLAGIGSTLLAVRMTSRSEDKRAKLADKRRIYANCLAALADGLRASILEAKRSDTLTLNDYKDYVLLHDNAVIAQMTAMNAVAEVQLIGSLDVAKLASETFEALLNVSPESPGMRSGRPRIHSLLRRCALNWAKHWSEDYTETDMKDPLPLLGRGSFISVGRHQTCRSARAYSSTQAYVSRQGSASPSSDQEIIILLSHRWTSPPRIWVGIRESSFPPSAITSQSVRYMAWSYGQT